MYIYILILPLVQSILLDDECYKPLIELSNTSIDNNGYFHSAVIKCLGNHGNVSTNDFIDCIIRHNTCNVDWYNLLNWKYCVCDSTISNLRDFITDLLSNGYIRDFTPIINVFNQTSNCLSIQDYKN